MNEPEKPKSPAEQKPLTIYQAIPKIMNDVGFIGKDRRNQQQKYNFRGIDDAYAALQKVMAKYGVFTVTDVVTHTTEERKSRNGGATFWITMDIDYYFYASDGSNVRSRVVGLGMDFGDKAANKAMAVGHKYALLQTFCIPTEEPKDPENDSHQIEPETPVDAPLPNVYDKSIDAKDVLYKYCTAKNYPVNAMKELNEFLVDKPLVDLPALVDQYCKHFGFIPTQEEPINAQ